MKKITSLIISIVLILANIIVAIITYVYFVNKTNHLDHTKKLLTIIIKTIIILN